MTKTEFRAASWEANGEAMISGYAVVFEQRTVLYKDPTTGKEYGEIISRDALKTAKMDDVILRFNHDGRVLARTRNKSLRLNIDAHGLKIEADMGGSDAARSLYQDVKSGLVDKMSFAFIVKRESWDAATSTRRIEEIEELKDVSLVDFPAYDQTQVSVRGKFETLAEPDRRAFLAGKVRGIHDEIELMVSAIGAQGKASDYCTRSKYAEDMAFWDSRAYLPMFLRGKKPDPLEPILHDILTIRESLAAGDSDLELATEKRSRLEALQREYFLVSNKAAENRAQVAKGGGSVIETDGKTNKGACLDMNTENREFYQKFVEARAAGNTTTMTNLIPESVMSQYVIEHEPGAFYNAASKTTIAHQGNLSLPIATLRTVSEHTENEEITPDGYVPGVLEITHAEYCYMSAYSDLGMTIGAENLEKIVKDTCLRSMFKKMDGLCIGAVSGLTFTDDTNAVKVTTAPSFADCVKVAGMLGADYLEAAKWRCAPATYFNWLLGLVDDNGRPILDASKLVNQQALCGYGIELDSQVPANVVYFGDGSRVHMNFARSPELKAWTDNDHNTEKVSVRCIAGAAAETGCMVKLYK